MPLSAPRICCLDMDTFFVSVERVLDPSLKGKPVVVGAAPGKRGVVTAASYEVRAFGVRSGMPIAEAVRRAPEAIYLPTRHGVYGPYAARVRRIIERFCPVVQVASIDEFFLDFRGCERLYRRPDDLDDDATIRRAVAETTAAIRHELGLPSSAGIATSRPVAKIASGLAKPAGVLLVPAGGEREFLAPLPVGKYPGIGPKAQARLARQGITTLGQLAELPDAVMRRLFGAWGSQIRCGVSGAGGSTVGPDRPAFIEHDPVAATVGSISNERTFHEDEGDPNRAEAMLAQLCERVCWRARRRGVKARTISLKLRYADFQTLSRSRTVEASDSEKELWPVLQQLYREARTRPLPLRLLGVALSNLRRAEPQLSLFAPPHDPELCQAVDRVRARYGFSAVNRAVAIGASAAGKERGVEHERLEKER